jgi:hypothetical protein
MTTDPRQLILDGVCPVCLAGPFRVPLQHVSRVHRMPRRQARDAFDLTWSERACDQTHSDACRARWFANHDAATPRRRGEPQRRSQRGWAIALAILEAGRQR